MSKTKEITEALIKIFEILEENGVPIEHICNIIGNLIIVASKVSLEEKQKP